MDSLITVIAMAVAALMVVAIGVACWEMIGHHASSRRPLPPPPPRVQRVDLEIEPPAASAPPAVDEQAARRALLGDAMARMAMADPGPGARAWTETLPLPSSSRPPRPASTRAEPTGGPPA